MGVKQDRPTSAIRGGGRRRDSQADRVQTQSVHDELRPTPDRDEAVMEEKPYRLIERVVRIESDADDQDEGMGDPEKFTTFQEREPSRPRRSEINRRERPRREVELSETRLNRSNISQPAVTKEITEIRISPTNYTSTSKTGVLKTRRVETVETKLVRDLEIRLISAFRCIIDVEKAVESAKQELSLRPDYSLNDHFKIMDLQNRGAITYMELCNFLKRIKLSIENPSTISKLFEAMDTDRDGLINLVEFQDMVSPRQKEYKILLNCRAERGAGCNYDYEKVYLCLTVAFHQRNETPDKIGLFESDRAHQVV